MSEKHDPTRRDVVKAGALAGAAAVSIAGPAIRTVRAAATDQIPYGMIGTGGRGAYLLKHLKKVDNGRCVAVCDLDQAKLDHAAEVIGGNPAKYKDYRELLADRNVEAVLIAVPLFEHFRITRDALQAGKHTFCEKSVVFKPYEVHA